jgi:hypothetical protein
VDSMKTVEVEGEHPACSQNEVHSMKIITLHYIAFPGSKVTQNDLGCGICYINSKTYVQFN